MQMKHYKKIITSIFVIFLVSSLTVRSEVASNVLELTEGTVIVGESFQNDEYVSWNFSVDRFWHDTFFDLDLVDFSWDIIHYPPYDPTFNVTREIITEVIAQNNRSLVIPVSCYYIETTEYNITFFFDIAEDLNITEDDLKVIYNGTTYIFDDIDPGESFYPIASIWMLSFAVGNSLLQQLMPFTPYAISPQATIGQEIQFGQYNGTVVGYTDYYISETEYFETIEVYHDEVVVIIDIFGPEPYIIGDRTLFYEKNTGIVLHWLEYNSSEDFYYYYNATDVIGLNPIVIPEFSVPFIAVIGTILIAIPILIVFRRKK